MASAAVKELFEYLLSSVLKTAKEIGDEKAAIKASNVLNEVADKKKTYSQGVDDLRGLEEDLLARVDEVVSSNEEGMISLDAMRDLEFAAGEAEEAAARNFLGLDDPESLARGEFLANIAGRSEGLGRASQILPQGVSNPTATPSVPTPAIDISQAGQAAIKATPQPTASPLPTASIDLSQVGGGYAPQFSLPESSLYPQTGATFARSPYEDLPLDRVAGMGHSGQYDIGINIVPESIATPPSSRGDYFTSPPYATQTPIGTPPGAPQGSPFAPYGTAPPPPPPTPPPTGAALGEGLFGAPGGRFSRALAYLGGGVGIPVGIGEALAANNPDVPAGPFESLYNWWTDTPSDEDLQAARLKAYDAGSKEISSSLGIDASSEHGSNKIFNALDKRFEKGSTDKAVGLTDRFTAGASAALADGDAPIGTLIGRFGTAFAGAKPDTDSDQQELENTLAYAALTAQREDIRGKQKERESKARETEKMEYLYQDLGRLAATGAITQVPTGLASDPRAILAINRGLAINKKGTDDPEIKGFLPSRFLQP